MIGTDLDVDRWNAIHPVGTRVRVSDRVLDDVRGYEAKGLNINTDADLMRTGETIVTAPARKTESGRKLVSVRGICGEIDLFDIREVMNEPVPIDPQVERGIHEIHKMLMSVVYAIRDRGPVDLQSVWIRIVEASIGNGSKPSVAMSNADDVVSGFKDRARKLAEDSASLAYISVSPTSWPDSTP